MKVRIIKANGVKKREAVFNTEFIEEFLKDNSVDSTANPNLTIGPGIYGDYTAGDISRTTFSTNTTSSADSTQYTDPSFYTFVNGSLAKLYLSTS